MSKSAALALKSLEELIGEAMSNPYLFRIMTTYNVKIDINSNWIIPERFLEDIHILYVVSGAGAYVVEDQTIELGQNNLLFIMNGIRHRAYRKKDSTFQIIPIRFRLYCPREDKLVPSQIEPFYFSYSPSNSMNFHSLFESIHKCNQLQPSVIKDTYCHAGIARALAEIHSDYGIVQNGHPIHPGILKLKEYMSEHPAERFNLQQLSDVAGLSPSYCSKIFHQSVGMPLKEYQIMKRIEYAEYLLKHSNHSVKEMALIVGYSDPYSFSKQFKHYRGYPPSSVTTNKY